MKRLFSISLAILGIASLCWAGTKTTNLELYKPAIDETNWGASVNTNFDTIDSRFGQIFNVKDARFGATGNGTTDDTIAIETTIAAASAGDIIVFPNGTYKTTNSIQYLKGVSVIGLGYVLITGNYNGPIFDFDGSGATAGVIGTFQGVAAEVSPFGLDNISFRNMTPNAAWTAQCGVRIRNSHFGTFNVGKIINCYAGVKLSATTEKNTFWNRISFRDIIAYKYGVMIDESLTDNGLVRGNNIVGGPGSNANSTTYITDGVCYLIYSNGGDGNYYKDISFQGSTTSANNRLLYLKNANANIFEMAYLEGGLTNSTKIVLDTITNNRFMFPQGGYNPTTEIDGFDTSATTNDWLGDGSPSTIFQDEVVTPILYGSYAVDQELKLVATRGVGGGSEKVSIRVGNKGATEVATFTPSLMSLKTRVWVTGNMEPATDNTYYLGKNDDDTPHAWKGVCVKDTTNGKYYRIEVINGTVTATDLSD